MATLQDLETWWSIDDVQKANEVLDAWHAAEAAQAEKKP